MREEGVEGRMEGWIGGGREGWRREGVQLTARAMSLPPLAARAKSGPGIAHCARRHKGPAGVVQRCHLCPLLLRVDIRLVAASPMSEADIAERA
eukprot:62547-Rhodomonas_salina.2